MVRASMSSAVLCAFVVACGSPAIAQTRYFPERFDWQRRTPTQAAMDGAALDEAVKLAVASENTAPKDLLVAHATSFGANEPFDNPIGPIESRSPTSGLVIRGGYVI